MNDSSPGSAQNLKYQLLHMIFPGGINGLPNDGCGGVKSSPRREPDVPGDLLRALFGNVTEPPGELRLLAEK
jgi:hypothetical protein